MNKITYLHSKNRLFTYKTFLLPFRYFPCVGILEDFFLAFPFFIVYSTLTSDVSTGVAHNLGSLICSKVTYIDNL